MASTSSPDDPYVFSRDNRSSVRLNYNHWLVVQLSGYLLHPNIPTLSSDYRVADIGAGTGIWLTELSGDLPHTITLDGFDISSAQYPPRAWLPRNLNLRIHNAFNPFPQKILGTYDVVNLRFLITVLDRGNLDTLFGNLANLLKPKGYLQWLDLDPRSARALAPNPLMSTTAVEKIVALVQHPQPDVKYDWISDISPILRSHGLEVLVHDHIPLQDRYRTLWNQSHLMGYEEFWAKRAERQNHGAEITKESRDALVELAREMKEGVSLDAEYFCLVARKAPAPGDADHC